MTDWSALESVEISPSSASMPDDGRVRFTATGHFDGGPDEDVTAQAFWMSDNQTVAYISWATPQAQTQPGVAYGVSPGSVNISANVQYGGLPTVAADPVPLTVTAHTPAVDPEGRFLVAFDSDTLDPYPDWTRLDDHPNLVTSYTIDRGRGSELDAFDPGRATVQIADPDGILDPTNPSGPYYGQIRPLLPAAIGRRDPVTDEWSLRFRGFVYDFSYDVDKSQKLSWLTLSLVDLFEVINAAQMQPQQYGLKYLDYLDLPEDQRTGQIIFNQEVGVDRINDMLVDFGLARRMRRVLASDPVLCQVQPVVYSVGESVLSAIQETADADFPAVANILCDRRGRFCFRPRSAKFYPAAVSAAAGSDVWDWHQWDAGDGAALDATPGMVQLRVLGFSKGVGGLINNASAAPVNIADENVLGQLVIDSGSNSQYGTRSWTATSLLTGYIDSPDDTTSSQYLAGLDTTRTFASYYVLNYRQPRDRITRVGFRPLDPADPRAPALWQLLNKIDLGDTIDVTVANPGGGGFTADSYTVEGIHEDVKPLAAGYDDVTLALDLSPRPSYLPDPAP